MLVLLPPSEKKSDPPRRGSTLDLDGLSFPALNSHRDAVVDALVRLSGGPQGKALTALKLTEGQVDELARNVAIPQAHTTKVSALYTGVLYDALSYATLSAAARRRANARLVVASALFGALRPNDKVPAYRLSGGVSLPKVGVVTTSWQKHLAEAIPEAAGSGVVIDLRSSAYAPMWQPDPDLAARTTTIRVLHERIPGDPSSRVVVSHFNKATKGRVVRELLESGADPRTPEALADLLAKDDHEVVLHAPRRGKPRAMDLVVTQL